VDDPQEAVPQVQPSLQRCSAVQVQFPPHVQSSVQVQFPPQVQPSLHRWSAVHAQFPPHVQSSVQVQGVWSLFFSANATGRPKPASASTAAAMRSFFTLSPFDSWDARIPAITCNIILVL
jgi:hypothetical protein